MEMSQEIDKISPAFVKVQGAITDPEMNAINSFVKKADGTPHKYADLTGILKLCRAELTKNDIAVLQTTRSGESLLSLIIITTLVHTSGQWFRGEVEIPFAAKRDAQGVGSIITYGRRYGLSAIMGIAQQEDDDGEAAMNREQEGGNRSQGGRRQSTQKQRQAQRNQPATDDATRNKPISEERLAYLEQLIGETQSDRQSFLRFAHVKELKDLTNGKYEKARNALESKAMDQGIELKATRPAEDQAPAEAEAA